MGTQSDRITMAEAAVILGVSTRTVERRLATGKLSAVKAHGITYLSRAEVQAHLDAGGNDHRRKPAVPAT